MTDSASPTGSSTDPLSQLAETPVERTTSEAHPEAMPPVAGAADPHVLADGLTESPAVPREDDDDAVRRAADAATSPAGKKDGDKDGAKNGGRDGDKNGAAAPAG